jgi:hypothetical protein
VLVVVWVGPFDGAEDIGLGVGSIVSVGGVVFGELVFGARVGGEIVRLGVPVGTSLGLLLGKLLDKSLGTSLCISDGGLDSPTGALVVVLGALLGVLIS